MNNGVVMMDNDDIIEKINARNMKAIAETDIVDAITASNMNAMSETPARFAEAFTSIAGLMQLITKGQFQFPIEAAKAIEKDKDSEAKIIKDKLTVSKRKIQLGDE